MIIAVRTRMKKEGRRTRGTRDKSLPRAASKRSIASQVSRRRETTTRCFFYTFSELKHSTLSFSSSFIHHDIEKVGSRSFYATFWKADVRQLVNWRFSTATNYEIIRSRAVPDWSSLGERINFRKKREKRKKE